MTICFTRPIRHCVDLRHHTDFHRSPRGYPSVPTTSAMSGYLASLSPFSRSSLAASTSCYWTRPRSPERRIFITVWSTTWCVFRRSSRIPAACWEEWAELSESGLRDVASSEHASMFQTLKSARSFPAAKLPRLLKHTSPPPPWSTYLIWRSLWTVSGTKIP